MKKTLFNALALVLLVGAAVIFPLTAAHALEVFSAESELRQYNPEKSYGGYFMPSQGSPGTVYLIDMMGYVVHKWEKAGAVPKLLPNGNLGSIGQLMDWEGNILWSFDPAKDLNRPDLTGMHHDGRWVWNKKLKQYTNLIISHRTVTKEEIVAAGGDPSWDYSAKGKTKAGVESRIENHDVIIEVNKNKQIVWEWRFTDHTCQSKNPAWPNYVSDTKLAPGKLDVFWMTDMRAAEGTSGVVEDWQHTNSLDLNEDLDQIVVNSKHWSTFFIIDHGKTFVSTTDFAANRAAAAGQDGDFIYRFGSPSAYNQGKAPNFGTSGHNQLYGAHDIQWIRPYHWERPHPEAGDTWPDPVGYTKSGIALPGAGHLLIFDNGCFKPTGFLSSILEINPYINAAGVDTGNYVNPPDAGYTKSTPQGYGPRSGLRDYRSKQIVWSYRSKSLNSFFALHISGMQRLPNGNTSINSGAKSHMFEVTPTGEVVWEYLYPDLAGPDAKTIVTDSDDIQMYRHYRYGTDYPGLAGRDLTRISTITGRIPSTVGSDFKYPSPVTYTGFGFGATGVSGGGGGGLGAGSSGGSGY